jgi:hypothetical protein
MTTVTAIERPDQYSEDNLRFAAEKLADAMIADGSLDGDREEVVADLADVLKDGHHDDGYQLARSLESYHCWSPNTGIVEHLDMAWHYVNEAHRKSVKEWVDANGIKADRKVGDPVRIRDGRKPELIDGVIATIYEDEARYVVCCQSLGHVPEGQFGTRGIYKDYDQVFDAESR